MTSFLCVILQQICSKAVYVMDPQIDLDGSKFHRHCAKCKDCNCQINLLNFNKNETPDLTFLLCKTHYFQRFNEVIYLSFSFAQLTFLLPPSNSSWSLFRAGDATLVTRSIKASKQQTDRHTTPSRLSSPPLSLRSKRPVYTTSLVPEQFKWKSPLHRRFRRNHSLRRSFSWLMYCVGPFTTW